MKNLVVISTLLAVLAMNTNALLISGIGPSAWNSDLDVMNLNLEIDATFMVEDFEDNKFISGLHWSGDAYNTLPTLVSAPSNAPLKYPGNWDGNNSLKSGNGYDLGNPSFSFDYDLVEFGIGITGQSSSNDLKVIVDGTLITNTFSVPGLDFVQTDNEPKNGYLWIRAENNEHFNKVEFIGTSGYQFYLDHAALKVATGTSVPEPGILSLIISGIVAIGAARKKRMLR